MRLEADFSLVQGDFELTIALTLTARRIVLFGRSGAGKSSLLNVIAGLSRPRHGFLAIDGDRLFDARSGLWLPAHRRGLGCVFQDGRLLPHLTVRENLRYGLRFRRAGAHAPREEDLVELLALAPLLGRRPDGLSGGERQRVAIGRALAAGPRLLLMDEPLASLDAGHRQVLLGYIERLVARSGVPLLYVTHSVEELVRLAECVVLLEAGRVRAIDSPAALLARSDLLNDAEDFEGGGLLPARVVAHDAAYALTHLECPGGSIKLPRVDLPAGTPVRLRLRAGDLGLALTCPTAVSFRNCLAAEVVAVEPAPAGPYCVVGLRVGGHPLLARITREAADELGLRAGLAVKVLVKGVALEHALLDALRAWE
jgi:molybdate transport system ATP-binding protein